jgi:hypothetical protein
VFARPMGVLDGGGGFGGPFYGGQWQRTMCLFSFYKVLRESLYSRAVWPTLPGFSWSHCNHGGGYGSRSPQLCQLSLQVASQADASPFSRQSICYRPLSPPFFPSRPPFPITSFMNQSIDSFQCKGRVERF